MENGNLIPADEFCIHYNIEYSFLSSLQDVGLIRITTVEEKGFIHTDQLLDIEKFIHLHYELDLNPEGLEVVSHLLERIKALQSEVLSLKNRLRMYESL